MSKANSRLVFFTTLVSPIIGVILGFLSGSNRTKQWVFLLFMFFFGLTIYVDPAYDGYRHKEAAVTRYSDMTLEDYLEESFRVITLSSYSGESKDLYLHTISFVTIALLGWSWAFFPFVALVYGFFYIKSILYLYKRAENKDNWIFIGFLILLVIWKSIEGMSTVRTWTGLWVLFYGFIRFYDTRNWKYVLLMLFSMQIHFSYALMALPALTISFVGAQKKLVTLAFLGSFIFLGAQNPLQSLIASSDLGARKLKSYDTSFEGGYADELQAKQTKSQGGAFYAVYVKNRTHLLFIGFLGISLVLSKTFHKNMKGLALALVCVGLLNYTLANVLSSVIAIHNRSRVVAGLFIIGGLVLHYGSMIYHNPKRLKWNQGYNVVISSFFVSMIPLVIYTVMVLLIYTSIFMVFTPILHFILDLPFSIRMLITVFTGL